MTTSAIRTLFEAVEARLDALGFRASDETFDFDHVPASVLNGSYRIESRLVSKGMMMGQHAKVQEDLSIYIAYKPVKRSVRSAQKQALDDREAIEKDVINNASILTLASSPLLWINHDASAQKYVSDILISRLVISADYLIAVA